MGAAAGDFPRPVLSFEAMTIYHVNARKLYGDPFNANIERTTIGYFGSSESAQKAKETYDNKLSKYMRKPRWEAEIIPIEVQP